MSFKEALDYAVDKRKFLIKEISDKAMEESEDDDMHVQ